MSGRRANGEGTVYKRKDGRYEGAVYLPTIGGSRKRIRVYGATAVDVRDRLAAKVVGAKAGMLVSDAPWTLDAYLTYWLQNMVRINRRPKTYVLYESTARLYLRPGLGRTSLNRLTVSQVQQFLNTQLANGRSIRTVQLIRTVLSAALTRAMREERISRNVARLVELPAWERKEIRPWTAANSVSFLAATKDHDLYPAFLILTLYGLRRGEVLGLRWEDVDFSGGVLHIRQQLQHVGSGVQIGPVKTAAGRRDLPLLDAVRIALQHHQERANQVAPTGNGIGLVFISHAGTAIEPHNFARTFQLLVASAALPRITIHHLRHTTATLLKNAGVDARDAQLILGHAHISTTQQLYQHGDIDGQRRGLVSMERLLTAVADRGGSRQVQPSHQVLFAQFTTVQSGGPGGTRTLDTLLKSSIEPTCQRRLTEVAVLARRRYYSSLLGAAAVTLSRQTRSVGHVALRLAVAPAAFDTPTAAVPGMTQARE